MKLPQCSIVHLQDILKVIRAAMDRRKELPASVLNMGARTSHTFLLRVNLCRCYLSHRGEGFHKNVGL